ncbi:MAG: exonuclease subunit SbcD [Aquificaceae bacterium]|nr:exonuclease subunit SbcD [Aquificaceae bacterium]MCX8059754.1 exonuclease subunit SbcD [Aquificaceae bacterium]MDW8097452.1 exonuclease subunit SbcD [Aquificaceae bacterium]
MRVLHIADLHAGKRLYDRISRNEDLLYALEQVKGICKENGVEVLLIAGDIFDKKSPDFESQGILLEFLTELNAMGLHILLIAGNHDSYDFMRIYTNLRKLSNIHVFDRPAKNPADAVFHYGPLKVACLPYPDERALTHLKEDKERSYAEKLSQYMRVLAREVADAPYRIMLAHLMVDKAKIAGSELQSSVSPYYAVKAETLPEEFQYVALGHVHRPQRVEGAPTKAYYAGSLYQIDFSERGTEKYVNLLILEDHMVKVQPIKLDLKRELLEIRLEEGQNIQELLEPLAGRQVLVRVHLQVRLSDPSYSAKKELVQSILGEKLARLELEPIREEEGSNGQIESFDLLSLYREFHREKYGALPLEKLEELLAKLIDRVSHETHKS